MHRNRWAVVALLLVAALVGVWWWRSRTAGATPKYRTAEVDRGSIESVVSATGTVRPVVQVEVGSQVSGTVDKLYADYNSRVRAGQVILQLEQSSFRAREVQAEAAVARAAASVKDAERGFARAQELFNQKYVSQAELDAAEVAVELRKADLKQARAQLEAAQVDLQHTTIRAPIDGVVISRSIDLGQTVAASLQAPKLFVIANNLSQMQVETRIDEADIGRMRPGLSVSFTVDAFPDHEFGGRVAQVRLEPIVEQGVVTYTTVITTGNPGLRLRPGMTANVTVKVERRDDVLRIPNAALRYRPPLVPGAQGGATAAGMGAGRRGAVPGGERGAMGDGARATMTRDAQASPSAAAPGAGNPRAAQRGDDPGTRPDSGRARGRWGRMEREGGSLPGGERRAGPNSEGMPGEVARGADLVRRGAPGGAARALRTAPEAGSAGSDPTLAMPPTYRPSAVYLLGQGKPERVMVLAGITDGAFTEVQSDRLKPGDKLIVGAELPARANNLQPPPGMGGPQFRGPGGGGRR